MLELGKESKEIHKALGIKIKKFQFNILYTVGKNMLEMNKVVKNIKYKYHEDNLDHIAENILKSIEKWRCYFIKRFQLYKFKRNYQKDYK